jgi:hypothetical protein
VPTTRLTLPPAPLVAEPVASNTQPVFPRTELPLLRATDPLTPADAAVPDVIDTAPDPELVLPDVRMDTEPPVPVPEVLPAAMDMLPPS